MYTKQEIIISSFRDGKSQRKIAKDLKISRKTVSTDLIRVSCIFGHLLNFNLPLE